MIVVTLCNDTVGIRRASLKFYMHTTRRSRARLAKLVNSIATREVYVFADGWMAQLRQEGEH